MSRKPPPYDLLEASLQEGDFLSSWGPPKGRRIGGQDRAAPSLQIRLVALGHAQLTIEWRLGSGFDARGIGNVRFRAGTEPYSVDIELDESSDQLSREWRHGVFRLSLPAADPRWVVEGEGPDQPRRKDLNLDPLVLQKYRNALAVNRSAGHDGVRIVVERFANEPERLLILLWAAAWRAYESTPHPDYPAGQKRPASPVVSFLQGYPKPPPNESG
jgi:hypothetical protein